MAEQRSCTVYLPPDRDTAEGEKAVRDAAIFVSMEYNLEALNVVPMTVEGTARRGWLVVLKGEARWLARLPAGDDGLARFLADRADAEWRYQFRDEGESGLARLLADYPEVDWLQ